jgi:hypothetical protein
VGKAQRAHHLQIVMTLDGGHGTACLCPPYEAVSLFHIERQADMIL